jgi:Legionella pneumophila major outer membrane protein precursor
MMTAFRNIPIRRHFRGLLFALICAASATYHPVLGQSVQESGPSDAAVGSAARRGVKLSTRSRIQPPSQRASATIPYRSQSPMGPSGRTYRTAAAAQTDERFPGTQDVVASHPGPTHDIRVDEGAWSYPNEGFETADGSQCSEEEVPMMDDGGMCEEGGCGAEMPPCTRWSAGVEFTFLTPHFEQNPAILRRESNNAGLDTLSETAFDYGTPLSPRVWLETMQGEQLGFRITYWQFDQAAEGISQSPPANGFGRIQPPPFGSIDLSTTTSGSRLNAGADLNAYTIDVEATECFNTGLWGWLGTAGIRYGEVDQGYQSRLTNAAGNAQGRVDFNHRIQGVGPTMSLRTSRPFLRSLSLFGLARGSLLYGDGETSLQAIEDQDLTNPLTTNQTSERDDLLPIGELQLGLQYTPFCGKKQPYIHLALEGQVWHGAGSASSEEGNLGFFGFNAALGFDW